MVSEYISFPSDFAVVNFVFNVYILAVSLPFRCLHLFERCYSGDDDLLHRQGLFLSLVLLFLLLLFDVVIVVVCPLDATSFKKPSDRQQPGRIKFVFLVVFP